MYRVVDSADIVWNKAVGEAIGHFLAQQIFLNGKRPVLQNFY